MGSGLMSPVHLAFVAIIALIFLGPKKLPELARSIGSGMREFRESMSIDHEDSAQLPVAAVAPPAEPTPSVPPPAAAPAAPIEHAEAGAAHGQAPTPPPAA